MATVFVDKEISTSIINITSKKAEFSLDKLHPNQTYWVEIFAKNAYGQSEREVVRFKKPQKYRNNSSFSS